MAGEGGILRLGKHWSPVAGADMGSCVYGLGGIGGAVIGDLRPVLNSGRDEQSDGAVVAVEGPDLGVAPPERGDLNITGELSDMNLRKST